MSVPAAAFDTLDGDSTRWRDAPDFSIGRLSGELPFADQLVAIRASFASWRNVPGIDLNIAEVNANGDITVDFLNQWPAEFGRYAAGVTVTSRRFGRITSARISINEENFAWSTDPASDNSDVQGVLTHEVGHALGFGHSFYRSATMYWSDTSARLRNLSPDDQRGMRFLYGQANGREGEMCDHCGDSNDCVAGGYCLQLENNRSFCTTPCANGCPENGDCFELNNGGTTCAPTAGGCSDESFGGFEDGDYCFGSDQCGPNMTCLVLTNTARCARNCRQGIDNCGDGLCIGGNEPGTTGVCMDPGPAGYNVACESDFDCQSLACLSGRNGASVCAGPCDPNGGNCPLGDCLSVGRDGERGICLPPGGVGPGQACGGIEDRCIDGYICVQGQQGSTCQLECEPFGQCPAGSGCAAVTDTTWACLPNQGPTAGQDCSGGRRCSPGLICAPIGRAGGELCATMCDLNSVGQCGGATCIDYGLVFGACPFGMSAFGDACSSDGDCAEGHCVWSNTGNVCSRACVEAAGSCPVRWSCQVYGNNRRACFRDNSGSGSGGTGGSGGGAGNGGQPPDPSRPDAMPMQAVDFGVNGSGGQTGGTDTQQLDSGFRPNGPAPIDAGQGGYFVIRKPSEQASCTTSSGSSDRPLSYLILLLGMLVIRKKRL